MKIACVLVPDFEVAVELARHPELAGRPVVVGGLPHERKRVRSCSPEAAAYGVVEGASIRQARGLCPEAVFLLLDEELYRQAFDRLLAILERFSPTVETDAGWEQAQSGRLETLSLRERGSAETPLPLGEADRAQRGRVRAGMTLSNRQPSPRPSPKGRGSTQHSAPSPQSSVLVYLDATGLERLFGPDRELGHRIAVAVEEETGLRPRVGLAGGKFVARVAALQAAPGSVLVVPGGEERAFLAPLPVGLLPCSEEFQRRMELFGLRTLGQLAGLPAGALGEQFGPEGVEAHRLARGIEDSPLIPREVPRLLEEVVEIDPPTQQVDLLLSAASALIERLSARMRFDYLACQEAAIQLGFSDGSPVRRSTTLHEPTDESGELLRAVGRLLGRVSPLPNPSPPVGEGLSDLPLPTRGGEGGGERGGISFLRLSLSGFGSRGEEQLGLFRSRAGSLQKVRRAVRQAEEQFGEGTIRPLAEVEGEKAAAIPLRVIVDEIGWPAALFLEKQRERVREICNRWRVREEWWRREIYRDYYRLITESGRLCVVYRDLTPQPPSDLSPYPLPDAGRGNTPFPRGEGGRGVRSATWFLERIYA